MARRSDDTSSLGQEGDEDDFELANQERAYREETGDKHWSIGYDARFARWAERARFSVEPWR